MKSRELGGKAVVPGLRGGSARVALGSRGRTWSDGEQQGVSCGARRTVLTPHFSEPCWPAPGGRGWRARPEQMAPRTLGCLLTCFRTHFGVWCLKKVRILVLRKKSQSIIKNGINFGDGVKPTGAGDAPGACAVTVPAALAVSCRSCKPRALSPETVGPARSPWLPPPLLLQPEREARPPDLLQTRLTAGPSK